MTDPRVSQMQAALHNLAGNTEPAIITDRSTAAAIERVRAHPDDCACGVPPGFEERLKAAMATQRITVLPPERRELAQVDVDNAWNRGYERGVAEGRRQATEGWDREWGIEEDGVVERPEFRDERGARLLAAEEGPTVNVVSRLVGPWEPAEQATPVTDAQYADQFQRIASSEAVILAAELAEDDAHMAAMEERHQHEAEQGGDGRG